MQLEIPEAFGCLFEPARIKALFGGRGAAKSESIGRYLLADGMANPGGILCARELQVSIADSVHSLLEHTINLYPAFQQFYKVGQKEITGLNGSFFIFKGLKHNIAEIKSLHGIRKAWIEEGEAVSDKSWEILIPTIRMEGSEIIISFNTRHPTDPTYQRFVVNKRPEWVVKKVSWRDNPFFPTVLDEERRHLQESDPEAYEHIWEGEFDTRYSGAVYAKFVKQDQITEEVTYDPALPVFTAWDLGYGDATSIIWYQLARNEIRVIDYYEANFEDPIHYCEQLYGCKIIVDEREPRTGRITQWHFGERIHEERAGYNYDGATHYVPSDAESELFAAGGRSFVDQALELGIVLTSMPAPEQADQEAALRRTLTHCWFNRDATKDLVQALMHYHYEYDEDLKTYKKKPLHDWSSHGCDAAELMACAWLDKAKTMVDVHKQMHHEHFKRLRRENKLDGVDPYRIRKKTDKRYAGRKK